MAARPDPDPARTAERALLEQLAFADGSSARERLEALKALRALDDADRGMAFLSEVAAMPDQELEDELVKHIPASAGLATCLADVDDRPASEAEDMRLAELLMPLRGRKTFRSRALAQLPRTGRALAEIVHARVAAREADIEARVEARARELYVSRGLAELEAMGGSQPPPEPAPVEEPSGPADSPSERPSGPWGVPPGIDPSRGWERPQRGIRRGPPPR